MDFLDLAEDPYDGVINAIITEIFKLVQSMLKGSKKLPIQYSKIALFFKGLNKREAPQSLERNLRRIFMIKVRE